MRNIKEQKSRKTSLLRMRYRVKEERNTREIQRIMMTFMSLSLTRLDPS
jgi:hypothetical protein